MYRPLLLSFLALPLGGGLATDYTVGRTLRVETATTFSLETTEFVFEIDGEPQDDRGGGGRSSEESRRVVTLDTVLEAADGEPSRVKRVFETLESSGAFRFGDREMEIEHERPLEGVTLEITEEGAEVVDGPEPDDDAVLEGHALALALDALLPDEEVEVGDTWSLDGERVMRALSLDLESALFVRPAPEDGMRGEGGERRRGPRGGPRGGGSPAQMFSEGEWSATATLEALDAENEAGKCARIALELKCSGELPEPEFGGGRGRRGRSLAARTPRGPVRENSFDVELEGHLDFLLEERFPVALELRGTIGTTRTMERSTERGDFFMYTAQEGDFEHVVNVTRVADDENSEDSE